MKLDYITTVILYTASCLQITVDPVSW